MSCHLLLWSALGAKILVAAVHCEVWLVFLIIPLFVSEASRFSMDFFQCHNILLFGGFFVMGKKRTEVEVEVSLLLHDIARISVYQLIFWR